MWGSVGILRRYFWLVTTLSNSCCFWQKLLPLRFRGRILYLTRLTSWRHSYTPSGLLIWLCCPWEDSWQLLINKTISPKRSGLIWETRKHHRLILSRGRRWWMVQCRSRFSTFYKHTKETSVSYRGALSKDRIITPLFWLNYTRDTMA